MSDLIKTGLVLSGGGAKGAYHVGVLKALNEMNIKIDAVAGASIGALNGAIVASASSLNDGYQHLNELWQQLSICSPIKATSYLGYLKLLLLFGERLNPVLGAAILTASLGSKYLRNNDGVPEALKGATENLDKYLNPDSLLSDKPLKDLIDKYLDFEKLQSGLPLYISAFETSGGILDIAKVAIASLNIKDTKPSEFFCVQKLPKSEQKDALMASAALPLLYESRSIGGKKYTDGGQGGWSNAQGNTPVTPLAKDGYNLIIVTHLENGSFFNRNDFPNTTIIELRPTTISRNGSLDIVAFNKQSISSWIEQGYSDTMASMGKIKNALENRQQNRQAIFDMETSEQNAEKSSQVLLEKMKALNAKHSN